MADCSPPPSPQPKALGRYRLLERIASGGMAEIYRATAAGSRGVEKPVAIKRILPHLAREAAFVEMFIDEARLMVQLSHPKVVQVLEFGEVDGELFMALELIDGIDALALLRACARQKRRLPVPLAMFIIAEVLDALAYVHSATDSNGVPLQVVHRDVSPSNIFIARDGYVKLGDFGVARVATESRLAKTEGASLKGKYGYMAPEQVGGGPVDGRADVFAAGIVLAEMLIGRRLFSAPTDLEVLLMVRDANLERLVRYGGSLAPEVRALVEAALQRSPDSRYPNAAAFRDVVLDHLFRTGQRVGNAEISRFIAGIFAGTQRDPVAPSAGPEGEAVLDGPHTNAARAEALRVQRQMRAAAQDEAAKGAASTDETVEEAIEQILRDKTPSTPVDGADLVGDLGLTSAIRLFSGLSADLETGMLRVDSDTVTKEIFFVRGVPEFVSSNAPNERLGRYLVKHSVITVGELSTVLAMLPRFNGKIGDTLVALGLMRPLDVLRYLAKQVRDKLIDVFAWPTGSYRYYRGQVNHGDAFPLRLDPYEIIGAAVSAMPLEMVSTRLRALGSRRVRRIERRRPAPEAFRMGSSPRELWKLLDGRRTVFEWMRSFDESGQPSAARNLHLLIEAELASTE